MKTSATTVHPREAVRSEPLTVPVVMQRGVVQPDLLVTKVHTRWPLDRREITIQVSGQDLASLALQVEADTMIAWPFELWDGEGRLLIWNRGRLVKTQTDEFGHAIWHMQDDWQQCLDQPVAPRLASLSQSLGVSFAQRLHVGGEANASAQTTTYDGREINWPDTLVTSNRWTIGAAVAWLNALGSLDLEMSTMGELADEPLRRSLALCGSLGDILESLCEATGLVIIRAFTDHPEHHEQRLIVPHKTAPIAGPEIRERDPDVISHTHTPTETGVRRWIAFGSRPIVEGTWTMVGGWAPALENQASGEYARSTSSDFQAVRDVYRRWVLNEHGQWSISPFNRSVAVDVQTLFEQPDLTPEAMRLLPCLALDDSDRSRGVIFEASTNSGSTWSEYAGHYEILTDEAGVYLDDDALDGSFLTAALNGTLRLRVTAVLRSPERISTDRWTGNALHGQGPTVQWFAGDDFEYQRVDASSIHAADIATGTIDAQQSDDRHALQQALENHINTCGDFAPPTVRVHKTAAIQPWLTAGKRVMLLSPNHANQHLGIQSVDIEINHAQARATTTTQLIEIESSQT